MTVSPFPTAAARAGRLPWPRPDELDHDRLAVHEAIAGGPRGAGSPFALQDAEGRLHGPFNAMLVNPSLGLALQELGAAIRFHTRLGARERELAILVVAVAHRSEFEWYAHTRVAERLSFERSDFKALLAGRDPDDLSSSERVVIASTRFLVQNHQLDESLFNRLRDEVGLEGVQELLVLVGYYALLATMMATWHTPLPDDAEPVFEDG